MNDQQMYAVYDKDTNEPIYWEYDQNKVLFVAHKVGRKTVTVGPVEPNEIKNRQPLMVENESFALEFSNYLSEKNVRKSAMNESTIISLTEMKIENVKEDLLIPNTSNPEQEAKELTDDTGIYHYTVDDDLTGKQAIVRTNVKALNEEEWIRKSFYTADSNVIEPNNFEKNDEYSVRDIDKIAEGNDPRKSDEDLASMSDEELAAEHKSAWRKMGTLQATDYMDKINKIASERGTKLDEAYDRDAWEAGYEAFENGQECPSDPSGKDGWMEAKKEHRKSKQMDEAEYDRGNSDNWDDDHSEAPDWSKAGIGLYKHNYLPLAYDDNSGEVFLYDIDGVNSLDEAEFIGMFGSVEEMNEWIKNNLKDGIEEHYKALAEDETSNIRTADRGVNNNDGDNYGPAPTDHQNDLKFDNEGKAIVEAKFKPKSSSFDSYVYLKNDEEVEVTVFYDVEEDDPSVGYHGGVVITSVVEKNTDRDLMDYIEPKDANRLFDEATADANAQADDHADYEYEKMRDRRMMDESEVEEAIKPEWIFEPGPDDSKKLIFYTTNNHDPHDANIYVGDIILKSVSDLEKYFPREEFGDYKFEMLAHDSRRFDDESEGQFTYDEVADDLKTYGSEDVSELALGEGVDEFEAIMDQENENGISIGQSVNNAINHFSYADDAADHVYGLHFYNKPREEWEKIRPTVIDHFKSYGLKESDLDEGKDHRFDPDADDSDWERQQRFKQRKHDKESRRKDIDEADRDSDRVYILSVDFTNVRVELEYKGMIDIDAAIDIIADGRPKDQFRDEIALGGVPATYELNRDGSTTLVVLDTTMRDAIELMCSMEQCQGMLENLEIDENVFFGFLIQSRPGAVLDDSTELEEDEHFEAPSFVVSTENLNDHELAKDPAFIQTMKDAYFQVAEEVGERIEDWDPSMAQIDSVISIGIENYPYAQKYSFLINDSMARDAVNSAFNILWDEGKINSPEEYEN